MHFNTKDYHIYVGDAGANWREWNGADHYSQILLLGDDNTLRDCLPVLLAKTPDLKARIHTIAIPAGETHKNMATCARLWQAMLDAQLDRKALVINLGGGVIGDMGGFCAATWKRGVDFVQMPTTLLSMTDAAIGGKLGVDFQGIKNIIGVFRNPSAVFADPDFLLTLPARELRSGFAEVIKHAFIGDPALRAHIGQLNDLKTLSSREWLDILRASIAVKVYVVAEDPFEKGLRMVLNYGHTIGHAVESYFLETAEPLTHGEAIAIGMLAESYLAYGEGDRLDGVCQLIGRFFPHRPIAQAIVPELWQRMLQDKKNAGNAVRMAVPGLAPYGMQVESLTYEALERGMAFYEKLETLQ